MTETKVISSIFMVNKISATLILPYEAVKKKGLDDPKWVVAEEIEEGILIHKSLNDLRGLNDVPG